MQEPMPHRLGENGEPLTLDSNAVNRDIALQLVSQARKFLCVFTHDLEHAIYSTPEFNEAVTRLAIRSRNSFTHILLQDPGAVVNRVHRLVDLAQRLSSSVEIRRPHEEHRGFGQAFLVVDGVGYLRRPVAERYEGTACFNDPAEARELLRLFDTMWEKSAPDPELRRLHL